MNAGQATDKRMRLGELLIAAGVLDEPRLQRALAEQQKWGEPLGRTLVQLGYLTEELLTRALSRQLGIPACDPAAMELPAGITGHLGLHLVDEFGVMPVRVDPQRRTLVVATADPTDRRALAELGDRIGWRIEPVLAQASRIEAAIRRYYYGEVEATPPSAPLPVATEASPAADAGSAAELEAMRRSLEALEERVNGQLRALRVTLEILIERGVLTHDEYLARLHALEGN